MLVEQKGYMTSEAKSGHPRGRHALAQEHDVLVLKLLNQSAATVPLIL